MIGGELDLAVKLLKEGQVIGIPTETVYGLAANALNEKSVVSIFEIKNRPFFDPLILHFSDIESIRKYVIDFNSQALKLAEAFWPGPLTILLKKNNLVPDIVTSGSDLVAVRIPNHPLTLSLLGKLDFPLAAPSANPFGYISPTKAEHVENQLGQLVPYILNGGDCSIGLESTIVDCSEEILTIKRLGGLSVSEIEECLGKPVKIEISSGSNPSAPGQLDKHYAPKTPFVLIEDVENTLIKLKNKKIAYLGFGDIKIPEHVYTLNLSLSSNLNEAAQNLFHFMRLLDNIGFDCILVQNVPEIGLGKAINDRIKRAAAEFENFK
jgi:L-threonylcarbamoyladenylate synthase